MLACGSSANHGIKYTPWESYGAVLSYAVEARLKSWKGHRGDEARSLLRFYAGSGSA